MVRLLLQQVFRILRVTEQMDGAEMEYELEQGEEELR